MIVHVSRQIGIFFMIAALGLISATLVIEATNTPGIHAGGPGRSA